MNWGQTHLPARESLGRPEGAELQPIRSVRARQPVGFRPGRRRLGNGDFDQSVGQGDQTRRGAADRIAALRIVEEKQLPVRRLAIESQRPEAVAAREVAWTQAQDVGRCAIVETVPLANATQIDRLMGR